MIDEGHSSDSSVREKLIEHLFVGEILKWLWIRGIRHVDVLRSEVDREGYDIVLECNGIMRHIQLKTSHGASKTRRVDVNLNLAAKPNGCVIWIWFDPKTLQLGPFLWFGAPPYKPLPDPGDRVGRQTRGNRDGLKRERRNIRVLRKTQFVPLASVSVVVRELFAV